jgi:hypothetical protein
VETRLAQHPETKRHAGCGDLRQALRRGRRSDARAQARCLPCPGDMEANDFDLEDVLRLARKRCITTPPCLDCVAEATTDLILNRDLGPAWDEILSENPVEDDVPARAASPSSRRGGSRPSSRSLFD